jgi:hypothetical protein
MITGGPGMAVKDAFGLTLSGATEASFTPYRS